MSTLSPPPAAVGPKKRNSVAGASVPTCFAQPVFVPVKESAWVPDDQRTECRACQKPFNSFTRRKHHCRGCAEVFCEPCSSLKLVTKIHHDILAVRVCKECFDKWSVAEGEGLVPQMPVEKVRSRSRSGTSATQTGVTGSSGGASTDPTSYPIHPSPSPTSLQKIVESEALPTTAGGPAGSAAVFTLPFLPPAIASSPYLLPVGLATFLALLLLAGFPSLLSIWSGALVGAAVLVTAAFLLRAREKLPSTSTAAVTATETAPAPLSPHRARAQTTNDAALAPGSRQTLPASLPFPPMRSQSVTAVATPAAAPILSAHDAAIVKQARLGLEIVKEYVERPTEWRTKKVTRADGSGSVTVTKEIESKQIALGNLPWSDETVYVQTKLVADPFHPPDGQRRTWKAVGLIKADPKSMLALYLDASTQTDWNKALVQVKLLRAVPGTTVTVTYSVSAPAVGGAVSSRDFVDSHEWRTIERTDAAVGVVQDYIFAGIGIEPPLWEEKVGPGLVRGRNGPSGFYFQTIVPPAGQAKSPDERWCLFTTVVDTDVRGWLPKSLLDNSMPTVMTDYMDNVRKLWKERRANNVQPPPTPRKTEAK